MLADGRQSGSPQLDAKGEARKYCFHVALDLGCASIPAIASGERTGFTLPMHHYHGILVGLCLGDIAAHHFIEHLREELVAQIIAVESNSCKSFCSSFFVYRRAATKCRRSNTVYPSSAAWSISLSCRRNRP